MKNILVLLVIFIINSSVFSEIEKETKKEQVYTRITSEGHLILDYEQKIAKFHDNVVVKNQSGTLKSDKLKVFFDDTGNNIEKMKAVGNVFIDQKEHKAKSDKAIYHSKENKLVLTGHPQIMKGENIYTADIITIDTNTNKVYFEPSAQILIKKQEDVTLFE